MVQRHEKDLNQMKGVTADNLTWLDNLTRTTIGRRDFAVSGAANIRKKDSKVISSAASASQDFVYLALNNVLIRPFIHGFIHSFDKLA